MNETQYHLLADKTLSALYDALEYFDGLGQLDVEYEDGALTIKMPSGKQWLVSKHVTTRQIWLASPVSGGLHFIYGADGRWLLGDGRDMIPVLMQELGIA
jgi:iron donor protein CyaY